MREVPLLLLIVSIAILVIGITNTKLLCNPGEVMKTLVSKNCRLYKIQCQRINFQYIYFSKIM
jgi:hypothetical protein